MNSARFLFCILPGLLFISFFLTDSGLCATGYEGKCGLLPDDLIMEKRLGFDVIEFEDAAYTAQPGAPCLPFFQFHVALPAGALLQGVEIEAMKVQKLEGIFDIMPVSKPLPIGAAPKGKALKKKLAIYEQNEDYPGIYAEVKDSWDLAGQDFVTLHIYPVQYNPVTGKVSIATSLEYKVVYQKNKYAHQESFNFSDKVKTQYLARMGSLAVNPEEVHIDSGIVQSAHSGLEPENCEYVIITIPDYASHFQPLADWRNAMGIPAKIVDTDWLYETFPGDTDQDRIRNFVKDAHSVWGAVYFLIGGDTKIIPTHKRKISGTNIPNDTYYADFDDDWKYEVYVGRACADSTDEIATFVGKVLAYETSPPDDFGNTVFFMGFDLDNATHGEKCKNTIKDNWISVDTELATEYDTEGGGHENDVKDYLNQGYNLVNHIDHCNTGILGVGSHHHNTYLSTAEARACTNGTRLSNLYSTGCYAGNYPKNCWGEHFVMDDQGGITFVGNSRNGWYQKGNTNTLSNKYDQKWWEALFTDNAYRAGETLAASLNKFHPFNSTYRYIYTGLNLFGDPALHLWKKNPDEMTVLHAEEINVGSQCFLVEVDGAEGSVGGALVCLMKEGDVYRYGLTDSQGVAHLWIDPAAYGNMTVTVTAQDCKKYQGLVNVTSSTPMIPHIAGISPNFGPDVGGTTVTVEGRYFSHDVPMTVRVGPNECTDVEVLSPLEVRCVTPEGVYGYRTVWIENEHGRDSLTKGFFYFPTAGDPFNGTDIATSPLKIPENEDPEAYTPVTLIASGTPSAPFLIFYSQSGGPLQTPFGQAGLDLPIRPLFASVLNGQGFALMPIKVPHYWGGFFDLYIHILGIGTSGKPVWSFGGNNPNHTGSVWFHLEY
ncbi:MAG: C25 family cysteine peptidase [Planctomycetota bacterium]|jgi:hypothetical protein